MQHPPLRHEQSVAQAYRENFSNTFQHNVYTAWSELTDGHLDGPAPAVKSINKANSRLPDDQLYILPGTHRLIDFEITLNLTAANQQAGSRVVILGAFRLLLKKLCDAYHFNYIFIDCGPSSGTINQLVFLSSDFIIPPVFADYFSTTSVFGLLTAVLDRWLTWHRILVDEQNNNARAVTSPCR